MINVEALRGHEGTSIMGEVGPDTEGWWSRHTQLHHPWEDDTRKSSLDTGPLCLCYFSSLWQNAWWKQLKGGKVYFISVSECSLHCSGEGTSEQSSSHHGRQEAGKKEYWGLPPFLSFNYTAQPQPMGWCNSHSRWIILHDDSFSEISLETAYREPECTLPIS